MTKPIVLYNSKYLEEFMKVKDLETHWICQLSKLDTYKTIECFVNSTIKTYVGLHDYYITIISALCHSPAWGYSSTNRLVNELTDACRAVLNHEVSGKTSAPAHARKLLRIIKHRGEEEITKSYTGNCELKPLLSIAELDKLKHLRPYWELCLLRNL